MDDKEERLIERLKNTQPVPSERFYQKMANAPWVERLSKNPKKPSKTIPLRRVTFIVITTVLFTMVGVGILATSFIKFWDQDRSPTPQDDFLYYDQNTNSNSLSVAEAQVEVGYPVRVLDVQGLYLLKRTIKAETQTVEEFYYLPSDRSPNGAVMVRFEQTPENFYEPPMIGTKARVESVMLRDIPAAYVQGGYVVPSNNDDFNLLLGDEPDIDDEETIVDKDSLWQNTAQFQRIAWQQGAMVYTIYSMWKNGVFDIKAFAEAVAFNQPIKIETLIGLPVGLPPEFQGWFENITFYDNRQAVIYEYRADDWFMFITQAPEFDLIFNRPEMREQITEAVNLGHFPGYRTATYTTGIWEIAPFGQGTIPPFDRVTADIVGPETEFQWLHWTVADIGYEIAIFNGCNGSRDLRPCYSKTELQGMVNNLELKTPDYQARRQAQAPVRASLKPIPGWARVTPESQAGFSIGAPRMIAALPWPYFFAHAEYSPELGIVWQAYLSRTDTFPNAKPEIPLQYQGSSILIVQKPSNNSTTTLLSGCQIPSETLIRTVETEIGSATYLAGVWDETSQPFRGHPTFCQAGQSFQSVRWNMEGMAFEITVINNTTLVTPDIVALLESMDIRL